MEVINQFGVIEMPTFDIHPSSMRDKFEELAAKAVRLGKYEKFFFYREREQLSLRFNFEEEKFSEHRICPVRFKQRKNYGRWDSSSYEDEGEPFCSKEELLKIIERAEKEEREMVESFKFRHEMFIDRYSEIANRAIIQYKLDIEEEIKGSIDELINQAKELPLFMQEKILLEMYSSKKPVESSRYDHSRNYGDGKLDFMIRQEAKTVYEKSLTDTVRGNKFMKGCLSLPNVERYSFAYFLQYMKESYSKAFYRMLELLNIEVAKESFSGHMNEHFKGIAKSEMKELENKISSLELSQRSYSGRSNYGSSSSDSGAGFIGGMLVGGLLFD